MCFLRVSLLTLAATLLTPGVFAQDDNSIVVEAVRFTGWEKCPAPKQKAIEQAFNDAIDLSNYVYNKIDWNGKPRSCLSHISQTDIHSRAGRIGIFWPKLP